MTQSVKNGLKRGLAVVLFTLLLVGAAGAVLSAFAAGVTALSNVHIGWEPSQVPTPSVTTVGPAATSASNLVQNGNPNQAVYGTQATATQVPPSGTQAATTQSPLNGSINSAQNGTQSSAGDVQAQVAAAPSVVDRVNQELSQMQSPVMQNLDAGGVSLGDKVQNAFGQFLGGLLQTLFVEQPSQGNSAGTPSQSGGQ